VAQVLHKPDALPVTQAISLKHWRRLKAMTPTT